MYKIEFDCKWFEWCIEFKCNCGELLEICDSDENPYTCDKCKRKYKFDVSKWELKWLEE